MGVSLMRMPSPNERGASLILILPVVLILGVTAILFIALVQSGGQSRFLQGEGMRAHYAAISAMQLSLLEIQPRTFLQSGVYAGDDEITVADGDALPAQGSLLIGGPVPVGPLGYTRQDDAITLDDTIEARIAPGVVIYLCRDLDGNGTFGTRGETALGRAILSSSFDAVHENATRFPEGVSVLYLKARARVGDTLAVLDVAQSFNE